MIGRNDPCPCGSGKKYKKCCLNKVQQVAGMVSQGMFEETIQAFQRMIFEITENYTHLLPTRFVDLEDNDLDFVYQVSKLLNALRNEEKGESKSYLDHVIAHQKKKNDGNPSSEVWMNGIRLSRHFLKFLKWKMVSRVRKMCSPKKKRRFF